MYQDFVYVRIGKMNNIVHLSVKYSVLMNDGNLESKEFWAGCTHIINGNCTFHE